MKSKHRFLLRAIPCLTTILAVSHPSHAATQSWIAGGTGSFQDSTKYTSGIAPVNGDIVTSDGAGSNITFDNTSPVTSLATLSLNVTSGATVFNQSSGTLSLGTLNFGGGGGSRNPTYNMNGGQLDVSSQFNWGNGTNARFNQSAGTVNYSGTALSIGVAGGARGYITMTGGTFNSNSVTQVNLGNSSNGNGQAFVDLSGSSKLNATSATFVIGQFGAATGTNSLATVTMAGTSELNTSTVVLGGNNATAAVYGVINLNGGTITAGSIRKGNSNIAASSTANVLHANGGTVKVSSHANNSNYFLGTYVDIQTDGLKFDTNGNNTEITNGMSGNGGLTKKGNGALILSGNNTYAGLTTVETGTLVNNGGIAGNVTVNSGATLAGGGTIGGNTTVNGTLAIGNSPESMDFGGDLTLNGTSIFELGGSATAGTDYDFANVTGTLTLGGALNIVSYNSYDLSLNAAYNLFDAGTFTGTFSSVTVGALNLVYDLGSDSWSAVSGPKTYTFTESNGVLTVVPEPGAALLGSIGALFLLRRRR